MLVKEVMAEDLVTADVDDSLAAVAERMLRNRVGSVLIYEDETPAGITTETDLVYAGYKADRPFEAIAAEEVMSSPLQTVPPGATLREAVKRMTRNDVKKLPVVDQLDIVGIVTMTDVTRHYSTIVREAHRLDHQRDDWESERAFDEEPSED